MLMHLENPQGVLSNGDECSAFSFAGVQCSMQMDIRVDLGDGSPQLHKLGQVSYGSNSVDFTVNTYGEWTNPLVISLGEKFYKGFDLLVEIKDMDGNAIDSWNATFADDTQLKDVYTYTSHRGSAIGTSLTAAWITDGVNPPTTTSTTVSTTTTTYLSTTPREQPLTCDDYTDKTDGNKNIYINGATVNVYCQYGTNGAYTMIQSRGSNDATLFNRTIEEYKNQFGMPGKGNNFWLGLDNMVALTGQNDYDLLIEVCCGGNSTMQFYRHFKWTVSGDAYTLGATASLPGIGLDFVSSNSLKKDIGMSFTTYKDMTEITRDSCDVLRYYGHSDVPIVDAQTGGWWFGSCGNNLNGELIAASGAQCRLPETFVSGTGVEMRTTAQMAQVGGDSRAFDGISYDRVRMAIYKTGRIPLATSSFCV
ncbi:hypothetical protein Q1695_006335 [Nippostrongylus brasiliensis]|nr:hypothetical protein Q1695_006335 [Nippostrongylus brasiliensis]